VEAALRIDLDMRPPRALPTAHFERNDERVWLNPFSGLKNAWVLDESAPEDELNRWLQSVCRYIGGIPGNLDSLLFFGLTETGSIPGYLRKADDDDILKKWRERATAALKDGR
jgi:hypothetical protein